MNAKRLSRRAFLKTSAAALAAPHLVAAPALGRGAIPAASERVTLGFVGVGWRGNDLVKSFLALPEAQCVAVSDAFASRRRSTAGAIDSFYAERNGSASYRGCAMHADFRELLERPDIDAVVVATPDHWHVPVALYAVRAGKDVYVEKPLGVSVAWGQVLRREIESKGAVFQFGTQQRSDARFRQACELARNARVGALERIEVWAPGMRAPGHYESLYRDGGSTEPLPVPEDLDYEMWIGPAPMSPYTKDRCTHEGANHVYDNSLGYIAGWGVHPLDIAQWGHDAAGTAPVEYEGTGVIPAQGLYNTIAEWDVRCRYADGVALRFMDTRTARPVVEAYRPMNEHGTTFFGAKGWVSVDRGGICASDPALLQAQEADGSARLPASDDHSLNFLECMRSRAATVSPFASAFQSYVISHLSDLAIRLERKIAWNPASERTEGDEEAERRLDRPLRSPWRL
ncbi:MAG: Gfo/Idh/MocA family oxidoreductase [Planctomycetes bacterium]|nr:Gfo/Idh/MocA family oxidoreductase [Planctomycetota bacterium]